jgi:hypothetical protein
MKSRGAPMASRASRGAGLVGAFLEGVIRRVGDELAGAVLSSPAARDAIARFRAILQEKEKRQSPRKPGDPTPNPSPTERPHDPRD